MPNRAADFVVMPPPTNDVTMVFPVAVALVMLPNANLHVMGFRGLDASGDAGKTDRNCSSECSKAIHGEAPTTEVKNAGRDDAPDRPGQSGKAPPTIRSYAKRSRPRHGAFGVILS